MWSDFLRSLTESFRLGADCFVGSVSLLSFSLNVAKAARSEDRETVLHTLDGHKPRSEDRNVQRILGMKFVGYEGCLHTYIYI